MSIDPTIRPNSDREARLLAQIKRLGLSARRGGASIRITGPDVYLTVDRLGAVHESELYPPGADDLTARQHGH